MIHFIKIIQGLGKKKTVRIKWVLNSHSYVTVEFKKSTNCGQWSVTVIIRIKN